MPPYVIKLLSPYFEQTLPLGMETADRRLLVEALAAVGGIVETNKDLEPRLSSMMDRLHAILVDGEGTVEERADLLYLLELRACGWNSQQAVQEGGQ